MTTGIVRVTHSGFYQDGRPNTASILLDDVTETGQDNQNRKNPVYVPFGGSIDLEPTSQVLFSKKQGSISKLATANLVTVREIEDRFFSALGTTVDPTTSSATFSAVPEMSITFSSQGTNSRILFQSEMTSTLSIPTAEFRFMDGASPIAGGIWRDTVTGAAVTLVSFEIVTQLSAGSHTISVEFRRDSGTSPVILAGVRRSLLIEDM
jgi:hypothetical protein